MTHSPVFLTEAFPEDTVQIFQLCMELAILCQQTKQEWLENQLPAGLQSLCMAGFSKVEEEILSSTWAPNSAVWAKYPRLALLPRAANLAEWDCPGVATSRGRGSDHSFKVEETFPLSPNQTV